MSPDRFEALAHDERTAFCKLFGSLRKLAEVPITDDAALSTHRRYVAVAKGYWANALQRLDAEAGRVSG